MFKFTGTHGGRTCVRHQNRSADSFCKSCRQYFCIDCLTEAGGYYYCGSPQCGGSGHELAEKAGQAIDQEDSSLFCVRCIAATEREHAVSTVSIAGFGTTMLGGGRKCAACGSVEAREWGCFFHIPVFPIAKFRVRWLSSGRFVGRKIKGPSGRLE